MNTPARLSLYGAGLVAAFGAAFAISGAVVPESVVEERMMANADGQMPHEMGMGAAPEQSAAPEAGVAALPGLSLEVDGYRLGPVVAPGVVGEAGELSFSVLDPNGAPLLDYTEEQEKDLHFVVVREDGSQFRHVHPELDSAGTWSIPWSWDAAGSYRVFADFIPADAESGITLTRSISVAGDFAPAAVEGDVREARAGAFDVRLAGDLTAGETSTMTLEVTRDGEAVTTVQPYLGAFGHLVALRDGDLAYLHVHPEGAAPEAGQLSGPTVAFGVEAPTPGRYLLYFDFQVDGEVQTAAFVVTAADGATSGTPTGDAPAESPDDSDGR